MPIKESFVDHLIVTVSAPDKPGVVEQLAACIAEHGGNWLESRMSHMAGQFAGILRVSAPADAHQPLRSALEALGARGIRVLFAEVAPEASPEWKPITMELVGNDRPGIVRDVTRVLTEQGVNLEQLVTSVEPAPMSSETLFRAHAVLGLPLELSLDTLQQRLETLADDLMVELHLSGEE
jgi:glycine cleavage system regulatory protein